MKWLNLPMYTSKSVNGFTLFWLYSSHSNFFFDFFFNLKCMIFIYFLWWQWWDIFFCLWLLGALPFLFQFLSAVWQLFCVAISSEIKWGWMGLVCSSAAVVGNAVCCCWCVVSNAHNLLCEAARLLLRRVLSGWNLEIGACLI